MQVNWRNAMLPFRARWSGHEIRRPWLDDDGPAIPFGAAHSPEPEAARRQQRDAGYIFEMRLVSMPANTSAGSVFIDQHLRKGFGGTAHKRSNLLAQGQQKAWYRRLIGLPVWLSALNRPVQKLLL